MTSYTNPSDSKFHVFKERTQGIIASSSVFACVQKVGLTLPPKFTYLVVKEDIKEYITTECRTMTECKAKSQAINHTFRKKGKGPGKRIPIHRPVRQ
jgi:hypothetical protein